MYSILVYLIVITKEWRIYDRRGSIFEYFTRVVNLSSYQKKITHRDSDIFQYICSAFADEC